MSGSGKQTSQRSITDSAEPENNLQESRACRDIYWDLTNLTSQMQMMSDSLVACRQMTKFRSLRKTYSVKSHAQPTAATSHPSVQVLLSPEQRPMTSQHDDGEQSVIVSYMVKEPARSKKAGTSSACSGGRVSTNNSLAKTDSECSWNFVTEADPLEIPGGGTRVRMYDYRRVDAGRMINVIQRELQVLMEVFPSVALLVTTLSNMFFHYKGCRRCIQKISPALPWLLNRIQRLIERIAVKRHKTYCWPNDFSYLRLNPREATFQSHVLPQKVSKKLLSRLVKIKADLVAEDAPGIQILLEVSPEKTKKRFFEKAVNRIVGEWNSLENFSVVQPKEPKSIAVVQVLLPSERPTFRVQEKREAVVVKELSYAIRGVFAYHLGFLVSVLVFVGGSRVSKSVDLSTNASSLLRLEEQNRETGSVRESEILNIKGSNDRKSMTPRNIFDRVPEVVRDLLQEAEEEKMYDLEMEVKGLKDLMVEVHRNQVELSKVLLEKGVYTQHITKLTDPKILQEESELVKKAGHIHMPGQRSTTAEAFRMAVEDVKHKCSIKNSMIKTLIKGLESNVPKEWWEEMVNYVFENSTSADDFDPEKVNEFLRQSALVFVNGEKASRHQEWSLRSEDRPTDEESNVKGNAGADLKENPKHLSNSEEILESKCPVGFEELPLRIFALPATDSPDTFKTSIRKLENQISLLNTENERLWYEVHDLKNLMKNSLKDLSDRKISLSEQVGQPLTVRPPGKTINLTIQIVDKDFRRLKDGANNLSSVSINDDSTRNLETSPQIKFLTSAKASDPEKTNYDPEVPEDHSIEPEFEFRPKSERRRSENDLNYLDDTADYRQEKERMRSLLKQRAFARSPIRSLHHILVATPHPSAHDVYQKGNPMIWAPPKYAIPETSDGTQAGPSRRPRDVSRLLQKPSLMELVESRARGMFATTANERELQTIPENERSDCSPSPSFSKDMSQVIQDLRMRVRSIHKDVTVLKTKNDRIDKLLDRLLDDAVSNNQSFEEMGNEYSRFFGS